jgi:hypothetical protein
VQSTFFAVCSEYPQRQIVTIPADRPTGTAINNCIAGDLALIWKRMTDAELKAAHQTGK